MRIISPSGWSFFFFWQPAMELPAAFQKCVFSTESFKADFGQSFLQSS